MKMSLENTLWTKAKSLVDICIADIQQQLLHDVPD